MKRTIEITLEKRGVSCVAELHDELAPRTCQVVWDALPQRGQAYHGKYARNEIYCLVHSFAASEPGPENPTVTPIAGDVAYFTFEPWQLGTPSHGYGSRLAETAGGPIIDLAFFYERNNLLLNADTGFVPGNVFATIVDGLDRMAAAAQDLWFRGVEGESLSFSRASS